MLIRGIVIIMLVLVILGVPYALRPARQVLPADALTLTMISPHNEAIRFEYQQAFNRWHQEHYGKAIRIDWRTVGATSVIAQYLASEYVAAFRAYWTDTLDRTWTPAIEAGFANRRLDPNRPNEGTPEEVVEARRIFLTSNVGVGIDVFFGGGWYDHNKQARIGNTVGAGIAENHPELRDPNVMPHRASGEELYDEHDRYYGCCLTCFGICYNLDVLERLGIERTPKQWHDLADPRFLGEIGLADPTRSGSSTKAFEMLIQQQIAERLAKLSAADPSTKPDADLEKAAAAEGFWDGMRLIQRIAANARYFSNNASKVPIDVVQGNAAAGMCIDFYGRFEAGMDAERSGVAHMGYITPVGGSSVSADPISLLRGAPHGELARRFVYFCLTEEGQKLWSYRVGAPGGPIKYALRRLPIRRDLYTPEHLQYSTDPNVRPYELAEAFTYDYRWTAKLFDFMRLFIRTMCIDTHDELTAAWRAILDAGGPEACPEAVARMQRMPVTYAQTFQLPLRDKLKAVQLAREWDQHFREAYIEARGLAEAKTGAR